MQRRAVTLFSASMLLRRDVCHRGRAAALTKSLDCIFNLLPQPRIHSHDLIKLLFDRVRIRFELRKGLRGRLALAELLADTPRTLPERARLTAVPSKRLADHHRYRSVSAVPLLLRCHVNPRRHGRIDPLDERLLNGQAFAQRVLHLLRLRLSLPQLLCQRGNLLLHFRSCRG